MKLLNLQAYNVFSLGNVELDLNDRGLTLVTGWSYDDNNGNMAGKSSLARNAPVWCMYGKTVDGVRADSVINTSTDGKHCSVTLHFEGVDGQTYRIYRARRPNSLVLSRKVPDLDEYEDLSMRNEKDTQELIDKLLGRDHRTFIQSDFFGQGREVSFLALPGSEQKAIIEEILPINSLENWHENAKKRTATLESEIAEERVLLRVSNERLHMLHLKAKDLKEQKTLWDTTKVRELSTAQHRLNTIRASSNAFEVEIKSLKESIPQKPVMEVLAEQLDIASSLTSKESILQTKIDCLTSSIEHKRARPDTCESCGQTLPEQILDKNTKTIELEIATRDALIKERDENSAKRYLAQSYVGICREINVLESKIKGKEEAASLEAYINQKQKETNPFLAVVEATNNQVTEEAGFSKLQQEYVTKLEENLTHYKFWAHAFGKDLKTLMFDKVCPYLERTANQYLKEMNNGQIKVKFSTTKELKSGDTKEEFCVTASSTTGSKVFELFSGAEKQLTSFAVGLALSDLASLQTAGASKFMILDEPFLYQSPENCENIISFITQKMKNKSTILLISNEDNLANLIPNRVHVVKRNGVSSIE